MTFEGYLFTLKKRMQSISDSDADYYDYRMFGYYDGFTVHCIEDKWYHFCPSGLMERDLQVRLNSPFADQFTIRAFAPDNCEELEEEGFAYSSWKKIGDKTKENTSEQDKSDSFAPFVTLSMLHLTEAYVSRFDELKDMQKSFITIFKNCISESSYNISDLGCAVYPSMGYADYIILFSTDNLKASLDVIGSLRGSVTTDGDSVISNSYSICGIDTKWKESSIQKKRVLHLQDIQLTVRINLRKGIDPKSFMDDLLFELKKNKDDVFFTDVREALFKFLFNQGSFYKTFGSSDCMIVFPKEFSVLSIYLMEFLLLPARDNYFFERNISSTRTSVRVERYDDYKSHQKMKIPLEDTGSDNS